MNGAIVSFLFAGLIAYLVGSTPIGLVVAKLVKGIDIRKEGSGNIGATNVGRILGFRWFLVVFFLDGLKGLLPTLLLPMVFGATTGEDLLHLRALCGALAIVGHMFSIWLGFYGGKGVATAVGVILVIGPSPVPWSFIITFAVFLSCFGITRIVSLSSMLAAIAFGISQSVQLWPMFTKENWSLSLFSLAVPTLIIIQHRSNIVRLLKGEEHQFRKDKSKSGEKTGTSKPEDVDSETGPTTAE